MKYDIVLAPQAVEDLTQLAANVRATVRDAIEQHLRHEPKKTSKSRIKRLRGLARPQYRLRVADEIRVFYDVTEYAVEVLAIVDSRKRTTGLLGMVKAMKQVALSEIKDDLSKYLRLAEKEEIVITRHGKPAGILVGFASDDDWFEYKLQRDPRFLKRIERARESLRRGRGVKLEDVVR
jgi:prevent-host-death family protein